MHLRGGSQAPENPPGPPQISPTVRAQTLQHLKRNFFFYFNFIK